jgi:hypothetical protein
MKWSVGTKIVAGFALTSGDWLVAFDPVRILSDKHILVGEVCLLNRNK